MRSFFSTPRRYDFPIPYYEATELLNKCQHLNNIIKKLLLMKLSEIPVSGDYRVEGSTFYTVDGDTVSGSIAYFNSGRASVKDNILEIDGTYSVLGTVLYTKYSDSVSGSTWAASGTVNNKELDLE